MFGPSLSEEYYLDGQFLRQRAEEARQRSLQDWRYPTLTGGPQVFEQAARQKEAWAAAPHSAPRGGQTPGFMNMILGSLGEGLVDSHLGPGTHDRLKGWAGSQPGFSMSGRRGGGGGGQENPFASLLEDGRVQRALQDPYNPTARLSQAGFGGDPRLLGLARRAQFENSYNGFTNQSPAGYATGFAQPSFGMRSDNVIPDTYYMG
jgi:hypothetical protein